MSVKFYDITEGDLLCSAESEDLAPETAIGILQKLSPTAKEFVVTGVVKAEDYTPPEDYDAGIPVSTPTLN